MLILVFVVSVVGDIMCLVWGVYYVVYYIGFLDVGGVCVVFDGWLMVKVVLVVVIFGVVSWFFLEIMYGL